MYDSKQILSAEESKNTCSKSVFIHATSVGLIIFLVFVLVRSVFLFSFCVCFFVFLTWQYATTGTPGVIYVETRKLRSDFVEVSSDHKNVSFVSVFRLQIAELHAHLFERTKQENVLISYLAPTPACQRWGRDSKPNGT